MLGLVIWKLLLTYIAINRDIVNEYLKEKQENCTSK